MFYRHHKTYQFYNLKHSLKAENNDDIFASSCEQNSVTWHITQSVIDWVTIGTTKTLHCIIPIQLTCWACFNAHMKYHTFNNCERFGHASLHTNPSRCIQVDIKRLLFSLAFKWHKFWGPKIRAKNKQKGDQFLYQMSDFCENCNPHSSCHTTAIGNVWLIFDLQKHVNWLCKLT